MKTKPVLLGSLLLVGLTVGGCIAVGGHGYGGYGYDYGYTPGYDFGYYYGYPYGYGSYTFSYGYPFRYGHHGWDGHRRSWGGSRRWR